MAQFCQRPKKNEFTQKLFNSRVISKVPTQYPDYQGKNPPMHFGTKRRHKIFIDGIDNTQKISISVILCDLLHCLNKNIFNILCSKNQIISQVKIIPFNIDNKNSVLKQNL